MHLALQGLAQKILSCRLKHKELQKLTVEKGEGTNRHLITLWDELDAAFKDAIDGTQLSSSTYEDFFHFAHNVIKTLKKE